MSSALQAKKRKEAEENLKQADKYLAKTMLRWSPDYLAAAPHLEKAADAFRAAGDFDTAKRVFTQAAGVQIKNRSSFRAAQNYENVAKVALQQIRDARASGADKLALLAEVRKAFDAASSHYGDMGELGKAADALLKAAASCDEHGLNDAVALKDLYLRACALMEAQDKPHFAVEPFRKTLSFCIKAALYSDALAVLARLVAIFQQIDQPANVHKLYVSELVLRLATGDVAAADQAYMRQLQDDAFLAADECALADDLVRAFKTGSDELLQATVKKQGFSFLDNQVARLARKLTIYGGGTAAPPASRTQQQSQPRAAAPSTNPFAPPAAPAPTPVQAAPVPAPVPVRAPVAAPSAFAAADAADDYDFDDTTARATLALPSGALGSGSGGGASAFDFDSLEFAMPTEYDNTASSSTATVAAEALATAGTTGRQPPVPAPAPVDDDMFDLT